MNKKEFRKTKYYKGLMLFRLCKIVIAALMFGLCYLFTEDVFDVAVVAIIFMLGIIGALFAPANGNIRRHVDNDTRFLAYTIMEIVCFAGTIFALIARKIILKLNGIDNLYTYNEFDLGYVCNQLNLKSLRAKNPNTSLAYLTTAADMGDTDAMISMAYGYSEVGNEDTTNVKRFGTNPEKEVEILKKAISLGSVKAMLSLALTYTIQKKDDEAFALYKQITTLKYASDKEKVEAYNKMAEILIHDVLIKTTDENERKSEYEKAVAWLEIPVFKMEYRMPEAESELHGYYELRESLARAARSLAADYDLLYKNDASKVNKVAGMYIYASALDPDLEQYVAEPLSKLSYSFSSEQIEQQKQAAKYLKYVLD